MAKTKAKIDVYLAEAKIMGKTFKGKGETIYEAIEDIKAGGVAGMVILTIKHGEKTKDRILPMIPARRLFTTLGLTREVALKNTSNLFEGV